MGIGMYPSIILAFSALLFLPSGLGHSTLPRRPQPRTYDTHAYYALELAPASTLAHAESIATKLGAEVVEPLGELAGHWLVRIEGRTQDHDTFKRSATKSEDKVLKRWKTLRSSVVSRSIDGNGLHRRDLRSLTPLTLRQRAKRSPHPVLPIRHAPRTPSPINPFPRQDADETELLYAQNDLHLEDPMLKQQWHLINTQNKQVELNVTSTWGRGITGEGVKVVIVDDGLDYESDDLRDNFFAAGSYDFNDHTDLPKPRLSDDQHGTRCAGEIAAVPNDVCGVGVAYGSKIAGVRILSAPISDADEAAALNYGYQLNDIYSCSWGPSDDGKSMEAPEGLILKAMVNGVQKGRGGKGSVFVFAAGNGGGVDDQCNFDGYTNSIFSITVGAVDRKGLHPYYSELCAAMMTVAPSSGSGDHIHTTDVGKDKCSHVHGGTSAAAPLAVGVFALALSVRPELTWRDMQHIAVRSSVFFNPEDPDWSDTAVGRKFSYKYGYGRMDAGLYVELAETWPLIKPQAWFDSPAVYLPTDPVPPRPPTNTADPEIRQDGDASDDDDGEGDTAPVDETPPPPPPDPTGSIITPEGITSTFEVTQRMLEESNFETLEHVTVRVWIEHQRRGDVEVEITSPSGIQSILAGQRRFDEADTGFPGWKFMSVKHWEENPIGTWTIIVRDSINPEKTGRFTAWSLQLWGSVVDASLAKDWAPAEYGETDEEETGSQPTPVLSQKPKPTDNLPDDHGHASGEADQPGLAKPTPTPGSDEDISEPTTTSGSAGADEGIFDGMGNLAKNSTWLAGAAGIILLTGIGVGAFFFFRARSRRRDIFGLANNGEGARGAYAPVAEDVPMGLLARGRRKFGRAGGGGGEAAGGAGTKDLYDAFGDGPSDESDDDGDDGRAGGQPGLKYHDDFLDDEGEEAEDDTTERKREASYKDEPQEAGLGRAIESASGSSGSGSWQDAAEEVGRA